MDKDLSKNLNFFREKNNIEEVIRILFYTYFFFLILFLFADFHLLISFFLHCLFILFNFFIIIIFNFLFYFQFILKGFFQSSDMNFTFWFFLIFIFLRSQILGAEISYPWNNINKFLFFYKNNLLDYLIYPHSLSAKGNLK